MVWEAASRSPSPEPPLAVRTLAFAAFESDTDSDATGLSYPASGLPLPGGGYRGPYRSARVEAEVYLDAQHAPPAEDAPVPPSSGEGTDSLSSPSAGGRHRGGLSWWTIALAAAVAGSAWASRQVLGPRPA